MRYEDVAYVHYKNVKISNVSYQIVYNSVKHCIDNDQRDYICLTDVSNLMVASKNEKLQAAINASLFSLADGTPLAWYARLVGCKEIERISGASLMKRMLTDMNDCKHYLLGDTEETISRVIAEARKLNDKILISGHSPPYKDFDDNDNQQMIEKIRKADADIIWVCFGGLKQEKWMYQNISLLDKGVMIGVGAAFRFIVGDISTPPEIVQKMGLQWLFRLAAGFIKNPRVCMKRVKERQVLTTKMDYLINLPAEVIMARKRLKKKEAEK